MGAVYRARQVSLDRLVALKTLQGALAGDGEFIARFRREAKAAASLNHPNLVQVHAAGETDGLHWFAMEFVEGESAQARLRRKGRLSAAEGIAIGVHVAKALDYAWRKAQLIHRDIKPDNIFLSSDGEVKLGDLGLAKSAGEDQSLTTTGASMGTPHYVSPEQGKGSRDVDLRADIYSLGCTLFHLVSGSTPYRGDTAMAVMLQHVTEPVPDPQGVWPEFPAGLANVVMKMMAKDPAARQQSHEEVVADLRGAYDAFSSAPVPEVVSVTSPPRPAAGGGKSKAPLAAVIAAIAVVAAIAATIVFFVLNGTKQPKAAEPMGVVPAVSADGWTNLLAGADVKRDSLMAPWTIENGTLRSPQRNSSTDEDAPGSHQMFAFRMAKLPKSYDLRYRITRNARGFAVVIPFVCDGAGADLRIDGGHGIALMPSRKQKEKQDRQWLPVGERHEVLIAVRENLIRVSVDGAVQLERPGAQPAGRQHDAFYPEGKVGEPFIGIGVCGGDITVHSAEMREVEKDGKPVVVKPTTTPKPPAAAPSATPAPVAAKATPAKFNPANDAAYVGMWSGAKGNKAYIIKADRTALKTEDDGQPVHGRWSLVNGEFQVSWDQGRPFSGKLAEDGQRIIGEGKVDWFRKKPGLVSVMLGAFPSVAGNLLQTSIGMPATRFMKPRLPHPVRRCARAAVHAAKKNKEQKSAPIAAPAAGSFGIPSHGSSRFWSRASTPFFRRWTRTRRCRASRWRSCARPLPWTRSKRRPRRSS